MDQTVRGFRRAFLGGFNRRDVLEYFERFARENKEQTERLKAQLQRAEEMGTERDTQLQDELDERERDLKTVREELERAQARVDELEREAVELREKIARMEPQARGYEILKDRVATVELDAHQKAQNTLDRAKAQADGIRADTARWMGQFDAEYGRLRGQVRDCADLAVRAEKAFAEMEADYQELLKKGLGEN